MTFSRDGGYVFYVRIELSTYPLYQVPVLGGTPKRIISEDADTPVSFSPDGKRFAFVRGETQKGEASLIVSNADGTGEQKLVTRKLTDFGFGGWPWPSWSPDGETIGFAHRIAALRKYANVFAVRVKDGAETQITSQNWSAIGAVAWLANGSGLIVTADAERGASQQLWHVSYPGGEARRVTNDTNNYRGLSLTADSSALVTVQTEQVSDIWIVPNGDANRAKQLTSSARNEVTS